MGIYSGWIALEHVNFGSNLQKGGSSAGVLADLPLLGDCKGGNSCCWHFKEDGKRNRASREREIPVMKNAFRALEWQ